MEWRWDPDNSTLSASNKLLVSPHSLKYVDLVIFLTGLWLGSHQATFRLIVVLGGYFSFSNSNVFKCCRAEAASFSLLYSRIKKCQFLSVSLYKTHGMEPELNQFPSRSRIRINFISQRVHRNDAAPEHYSLWDRWTENKYTECLSMIQCCGVGNARSRII
jgi:hypothetical protein